jgi:hypothetical protein
MKGSRPREKTDAEPILNAIVRTAARLCDASYCHLYPRAAFLAGVT